MKKTLICVALLLLFAFSGRSAGGPPEVQPLSIMFWNLENFFDWIDGGSGESDSEFSSQGRRHWTFRRFLKKCNAIAKTVFLAASGSGRLPDILCFAEVENRRVLQMLLRRTLLDKCGYGIVHYDSPDSRGIDVALLYRKEVLEVLSSRQVKLYPKHGGEALKTRAILLVELAFGKGDGKIFVAVNHHPSKYGGESGMWKRELALGRLGAIRDSLAMEGDSLFVACGDFNEEASKPFYASFAAERKLCHPGADLAASKEGSIRFDGKWELIDFFFFDHSLEAQMKVLHLPELLTRDNVHAGEKPFRTYSGPRYIGGVSDHLPIILNIKNLRKYSKS